jgi:UDP:flavonoid glycosyltransferase YjiC (YdhE family)
VAAFEYAPFSLLFPRAAAVVFPGGIGTTGLAMRAGRPMLVVPHAHDQPDTADRLTRLGIARTIDQRHYTSEHAATELERLLDEPSYSQRAHDIGEKVEREDGVAAACEALESLLMPVTRT